MAKKEIVDTVRGKYSRFDVVKTPGGIFSSPKFSIHKNGHYHRGMFGSRSDAFAAARQEAAREG